MKELTPYPLFGKVNIVKDDFLGGYCWKHPGIGFYLSPVINCKFAAKTEAHIYPDTPVTIFSNGTDYDVWTHNNCDKCAKCNHDVSNPDELRKYGGCTLEMRMGLACVGDGKIPFRAVRRIGYGRLSIQSNGIFAALSWCKEFKPKEVKND